MFSFVLFLAVFFDFTCSTPWRQAANENDNPSGLEDNTVIDRIEQANEEDHVDQKVKNIFEADIQLTKSDSEGVDTKNYNSKDTANVDVDSVVSKRKAISSRRHLWVTKEVPVELETTASKMSRNVVYF